MVMGWPKLPTQLTICELTICARTVIRKMADDGSHWVAEARRAADDKKASARETTGAWRTADDAKASAREDARVVT